MTKIYFVRHCETDANRDHILQGTGDFDISKEGEHQLKLLAKRFENINFDVIISSPLTRTRKTALAIKGERDIEILYDRDFIEYDFGDWQGFHVSDLEIKYPELFEIYKTEFYNFTSPGGESYDEFYARAWSATKRLLQNHNGKTVVVTSHGGTIRAIFTRLLHNDKTMIYKIGRSLNTAVYEVDFYDDGSFDIITQNDVSHLDKKVKVGLEM